MTEDDLDTAIVQLCDELELITLHVREPRREGGDWPGFPDRIIFGPYPPHVLYRELKAGTGLSGAQKRWRWRLRDWCRQDYGVWTAADWNNGKIAEQLAALAGRADAVVVSDNPDPEAAFFKALYHKRR
jgi:hypothetical protein